MAGLRELAAGRADLLAEVAGIFEGTSVLGRRARRGSAALSRRRCTAAGRKGAAACHAVGRCPCGDTRWATTARTRPGGRNGTPLARLTGAADDDF